MTKHQRCRQTVEYSGFLFDTVRAVMRCTDEKLALLQSHSVELAVPVQLWSQRDLDRVKGRLLHYLQAVRFHEPGAEAIDAIP